MAEDTNTIVYDRPHSPLGTQLVYIIVIITVFGIWYLIYYSYYDSNMYNILGLKYLAM